MPIKVYNSFLKSKKSLGTFLARKTGFFKDYIYIINQLILLIKSVNLGREGGGINTKKLPQTSIRKKKR